MGQRQSRVYLSFYSVYQPISFLRPGLRDLSLRASLVQLVNVVLNKPEQQQSSPEFEQFRAAELFCPRCQAAMPVREVLLLILPDGELFEYRCVKCGESLGKRKVEQDDPVQIVLR